MYFAILYDFYGLLPLVAVTGVKILLVHLIHSFDATVLIVFIASVMFEIHYLCEQQVQLS